jgi:hypothetical protein
MDIIGARWSVEGADATLRVRASRANGDFPEYRRFHLGKEQRRDHQSRRTRSADVDPAHPVVAWWSARLRT